MKLVTRMTAILSFITCLALMVWMSLSTAALASSTVTSQRIAGGEIRITCTGDPDQCNRRAERSCPLGYEVTSRKQDANAPNTLTIKVRCD